MGNRGSGSGGSRLIQGFIAMNAYIYTILGDEEGYCSLWYPKSPPCMARMMDEQKAAKEGNLEI
jgi:hypothetical protein